MNEASTNGNSQVLECRGVTRNFRESSATLEVLRGVDLEVRAGPHRT